MPADLAVEAGEIFSLLGPNGAGKTTLISLISGLIEPSRGVAEIGGYSITKQPLQAKQLLGVVPQEIALYPNLTARANPRFFGQMYGLGGSELAERVEELLAPTASQARLVRPWACIPGRKGPSGLRLEPMAPTRRRSNTRLLLLAMVVLLAAGIACARGGSERPLRADELEQRSLQVDGLARTYLQWSPQAEPPAAGWPLVLILHGGGGNSERTCTQAGGVNEIARREGLIVVCPQGIEEHWNDGRRIERYRAHREDIDDVGFLLALLETIKDDFAVNPEAVFITGASNGGMMTYRMACEAAGEFTAAAAMVANLPLDVDCDPSQPLPMLIMNGTEDPLMPYEGGQVRFLNQELGPVRSAPATAQFWAEANGCRTEAETLLLEDLDPDDGTRIRRYSYSGCVQGAPVLLYQVEGGGHTLPGGAQYAGEGLIGPVSRDAHAGEIAWQFFEAAGG